MRTVPTRRTPPVGRRAATTICGRTALSRATRPGRTGDLRPAGALGGTAGRGRAALQAPSRARTVSARLAARRPGPRRLGYRSRSGHLPRPRQPSQHRPSQHRPRQHRPRQHRRSQHHRSQHRTGAHHPRRHCPRRHCPRRHSPRRYSPSGPRRQARPRPPSARFRTEPHRSRRRRGALPAGLAAVGRASPARQLSR
jgi:hypothetical protein